MKIEVFSFTVKIFPFNIKVFDTYNKLEGSSSADKIVDYCISEGYCDDWITEKNKHYQIKVEVLRLKNYEPNKKSLPRSIQERDTES